MIYFFLFKNFKYNIMNINIGTYFAISDEEYFMITLYFSVLSYCYLENYLAMSSNLKTIKNQITGH